MTWDALHKVKKAARHGKFLRCDVTYSERPHGWHRASVWRSVTLELPDLNMRLISKPKLNPLLNALQTFLDSSSQTRSALRRHSGTWCSEACKTVTTVSQGFNTLYDLVTKWVTLCYKHVKDRGDQLVCFLSLELESFQCEVSVSVSRGCQTHSQANILKLGQNRGATLIFI